MTIFFVRSLTHICHSDDEINTVNMYLRQIKKPFSSHNWHWHQQLKTIHSLLWHASGLCPQPCFIIPPGINTGNYIGTSVVCTSVVLSVCLIVTAQYLLNGNHFLPNLVWWCIVTRRCVMWKNWFTFFSVKVTARAYFLLYLLNFWSICNQIYYLQCQGHCKGLFFTISSKLLVHLQPDLVC